MAAFTRFVKRMVKIKHMEFDAAAQQLLWAIISPKKLYRHHETKFKTRDSWARDDPAFLICICSFLTLSTIGYSLLLRMGVVGGFVAMVLTVFLDCILSGVVIATVMWFVCNKLLLKKKGKDVNVEWGYCFDVHLNSFVPLAVIVFGIQMPLVIVLQYRMVVVTMVADILWVFALSSYIYSTFLGYSVMGRLQHTVYLLAPVLPLLALCVISVPLGLNYTRWFVTYYRARAGLRHNYQLEYKQDHFSVI